MRGIINGKLQVTSSINNTEGLRRRLDLVGHRNQLTPLCDDYKLNSSAGEEASARKPRFSPLAPSSQSLESDASGRGGDRSCSRTTQPVPSVEGLPHNAG
jgi:hypothetical protein